MNVKYKLSIAISMLLLFATCKKTDSSLDAQNSQLRLNQVQVIASHNSYHIRPVDTIFGLLKQLGSAIPAEYDPTELDYTNVSLDSQLTYYGMRGLEIDIYHDPTGSDYYTRKINSYVNLSDTSYIPELLSPGFKVLHIKDVDYNTTNYTFKSALRAIKTWSDAHPSHLPLFINVETKEDGPSQNATLAGLGFLPPKAYDAASCDLLDAEIRSVFGTALDGVLTPDRVRGGLATLHEVVAQNKWPTLGACRGQVIFIMEGAARVLYPIGHPSLQGRAMFIYADRGTPEAAFLILNSAVGDYDSIRARVAEGYIIRTRADAGTKQARVGSYTDMNAAFASGAQITSTDYYRPDPRSTIPGSGWSSYMVRFPEGGVGRKNILSAANVSVESVLKE